jgi:hypothetical protein
MNSTSSDIKFFEQRNLPSKIYGFIKAIGLEGFIWITALIYLALFVNPYENHFTICPLANAGIEHCPGCGLGNSIALFFRGDFSQSFTAHFLGIPALIIILHRIYSIIKFNLIKVQTPTL